MKRKDFLKKSMVGGLAVIIAPTLLIDKIKPVYEIEVDKIKFITGYIKVEEGWISFCEGSKLVFREGNLTGILDNEILFQY